MARRPSSQYPNSPREWGAEEERLFDSAFGGYEHNNEEARTAFHLAFIAKDAEFRGDYRRQVAQIAWRRGRDIGDGEDGFDWEGWKRYHGYRE